MAIQKLFNIQAFYSKEQTYEKNLYNKKNLVIVFRSPDNIWFQTLSSCFHNDRIILPESHQVYDLVYNFHEVMSSDLEIRLTVMLFNHKSNFIVLESCKFKCKKK